MFANRNKLRWCDAPNGYGPLRVLDNQLARCGVSARATEAVRSVAKGGMDTGPMRSSAQTAAPRASLPGVDERLHWQHALRGPSQGAAPARRFDKEADLFMDALQAEEHSGPFTKPKTLL